MKNLLKLIIAFVGLMLLGAPALRADAGHQKSYVWRE
jgi:hypothetical protein